MADNRRSSARSRSNSLITNNGANGAGATGTGTGGGATTTTTRTRHKSGNASYADLITRAVLSSDDKRLTLSEIYDWMVDNVPGLKDQRYLHSAKGWKNAVRHTLSINPRFRKVARLGRPGWWTVDSEYLQRSNMHQTTTTTSGGIVLSAAGAASHHQHLTTTNAAAAATAAFIWDAAAAHSNCQQQQHGNQGFRGRLSSAPALFLSPLFATTTTNAGNNNPAGSNNHNNNTVLSCFPSPGGGGIVLPPGAPGTTGPGSSSLCCSRPPSSMSMLSSGGASSSCQCTPVASPKSSSEISPPLLLPSSAAAATAAAATMLDHHAAATSSTSTTQTVQIWQEGGVGLLTVPRPLPMRVANVHETATQTDENVTNFDHNSIINTSIITASPIFSAQTVAGGIAGQQQQQQQQLESSNAAALKRFRNSNNVCDYFENVSPVSSPLGAGLSSLIDPPPPSANIISNNNNNNNNNNYEQTTTTPGLAAVDDRYHRTSASIAQLDEGQAMLILTTTTTIDPDLPASTCRCGDRRNQLMLATNYNYKECTNNNNNDYFYYNNAGRLVHTRNNGKMENLLEELPEDLEGVNVDPLVNCDVAAVIKFEHEQQRDVLGGGVGSIGVSGCGRVPKLETLPDAIM